VTSNEGGNGNPTTDTVTVSMPSPPGITKTFGVHNIPLGGTTSLTFTISNPNSSTLTGVEFSDILPSGLAVAAPNGLSGSCGGGTISAVAGGGTISLTGATLAANAGCTFTVNVTATSAGTKFNTTQMVTSNEGGNG